MKQLRTLMMSVLIVLPLTNAQAEMISKVINYTLDGTGFESTLVYNDSIKGKRPAIMMVPNWLGPTDNSLEKAKKIAGKDYVVLMADMYGVNVRPKDASEAKTAATIVRADRQMMRDRAQKAVDILKAQADSAPVDTGKMAAIGFCFGGGAVLELARSGTNSVRGVVSFHGNLDTPDPNDAKKIHSRVLVLHGADDPFVDDAQVTGFVQEMKAADVDWQMVSFGGAVHSFTDPYADLPGQAEYNEKVAKRAYIMMEDFFEEIFAEK